MKLKTQLISIVMASSVLACMQLTTQAQSWSKTGNAGTDPTLNFIGTTDNNAFKVRTNNVERISVSSAGKVGIGTSSPNSKLHIKNGGSTTGILLNIENTNAANDSAIANISNNGTGSSLLINHSGNSYKPALKITNTSNATTLYLKNLGTGTGLDVYGNRSINGSLVEIANTGTGIATHIQNTNQVCSEPSIMAIHAGTGPVGIFTSTNTVPTNPILLAICANDNSNLQTATDRVAVLGSSHVWDGWGIGGDFDGGYIGIRASATVSGINSWDTDFGAMIQSNNMGHGNSMGLYAECGGSGDGTKYALYGANSNLNLNAIAYAGYFSGSVAYTGTLTQTSDRKLKDNIQPIENAMNSIMKLKPSAYNFRTDEFKTMNLSRGKHYGLIAQELQQVFPELVTENVHPAQYDQKTKEKIADEVKYLGVNYTELIPVLIEGMQEQQKTITDLKNEIAQLISQVSSNNASLQLKISSDKNSSTISKIVPNPFSDETEIQLSISSSSKQVELNVTDNNGKVILSNEVTARGNCSIKINTSALSTGMYFCTLIEDGQTVATQKMSCIK